MKLSKNKKILDNKKTESGFSIIETLVAIFILLISITGPMVFAQSSLRVAFQARDQVTAFYLAQDAIEYIKNRREHFALDKVSPDNWLGGPIMNKCIITDSGKDGCTIDTTTVEGDVRLCDSHDEPGCIFDNNEGVPLKMEPGTGYFGFTGDDSIFYRHIYIEEVDPGVEAQILVKVRWTSHDSIGSREIIVAENIFNWPGVLMGTNVKDEPEGDPNND